MLKSVLSGNPLFSKILTLILISFLLAACDSNNSPSIDNSIPVANAGEDQVVTVGEIVKLDASQSSDKDGDLLDYQWLILKQPSDGVTTIQNTNTSKPTFIPDRAGEYLIQLIVNDGLSDSIADEILVEVHGINNSPVANAGENQTSVVGRIVKLDGSKSVDIDGDSLSFSWRIVEAPENSNAKLTNANTFEPTLVPDWSGKYVIHLTVKDNEIVSETAEVIIYVTGSGNGTGTGTVDQNIHPLANAGQSQEVIKDATVYLDGSASSDADGDSLSYAWLIIKKPENSKSAIVNNNNIEAQFIADTNGEYSIRLTVNDGKATDSDFVTILAKNEISTSNTKPVANAGTDQKASMSDVITLDGTASADADGDPLSYQWALTVKPENSQIELTANNADISSFQPDIPGEYIAQLIVKDGKLSSNPDTVKITIDKPAENQPPIVDAGADRTITLGSSVTLQAIASDSDGQVVSQQWRKGAELAGDTLALSVPSLTAGEYTFTVTVTDNDGASAVDSVSVIVQEKANIEPTATDQSIITDENTPKQIILSGSDTDTDTLDYSIVTNPSRGTLSGDAPNLTYTPNNNYNGTDSFTFKVNNGTADSATATVSIIVKAANDIANTVPKAESQTININQDTAKTIVLVGTDSDGDSITYKVTSNPVNGTLTGEAPNLLYTPKTNYSGSDAFKFTVNDGKISSSVATVVINIGKVNKSPIVDAGADRTITLGSSVTLQAIASDPDGNIASYEWKKDDEVISNNEGLVLNDLKIGEHLFSIKVIDEEGLSAEDDIKIIIEDSVLTGSLSGKVIDGTGVKIINAKVRLPSGENTVSDIQGYYIINDIKPIERTAVTATRSGFLQNSDIIKIVSGQQTEQNIIMSRPKKLTEYIPAEGSMIETDGLTVDIPANLKFETNTGKPFDGDVVINTSYFPITTEEGIDQFPGDTIAINEEGEMGELTSFGYIKLEAKDQLGNPLNLAEGAKIEVSIPADDSLEKPATIPFWYFDEEKGIWVADGEATYDPESNTYKTTVDQVATFNLDSYAGNVIASVDVCIEDDRGNKIPGYVTLAPEGSDAWRNTTKTSIDGLLRLNGIIGQSNFNLYASSTDGRLGEYSNNPVYLTGGENNLNSCIILDNNTRADTLKLSGTIVDESGNAKPNIELKLFGETGGQSWGKPSLIQLLTSKGDSNGNFVINIDNTTAASAEVALLGDKRIVVKAVDGDTKVSKEVLLKKGQNNYNLGNISLISNQPPFANAGVDITQYLGDRVSLIAKKSYDSDGSIVSYEWRENDQVLGTTPNISSTSLGLGEHIIVLTVTDNFGLKASDEIIVNIIDKRVALFAEAGNDRVSYLNSEVFLDGYKSLSLGSPIQYEWSENGKVLSNKEQFGYQITDTLPHTITLKVTNSAGLEDTDEVVVSAFVPFEFITAGLDKSIYLGDEIFIKPDGKYSGGLSLNFKWSEGSKIFVDKSIKTANLNVLPGFTYSPTELGVHTLKLVITDDQGVQKTDTVNITVVEKLTTKTGFANAGLDKFIYLNENLKLSGIAKSTTGSIKTIEWSEQGTILSNAVEFDYTGVTSGKHTITLKVVFDDDSVAEDQVEIVVAKEKKPSSFFLDLGPDITIATEHEIYLFAEPKPFPVGSSNTISYEWRVDGVLKGTNSTFPYIRNNIVYGPPSSNIELKVTLDDGEIVTANKKITATPYESNFLGWRGFLEKDIYVYPGDKSRIEVERLDTTDIGNFKLPYVETWTVNGTEFVSFKDTPNNFSDPKLSTYPYNFDEVGRYEIKYKAQHYSRPTGDGFETDTVTQIVNVLPLPVPHVNAGLDDTLYLGEKIVLDTGNSYSYRPYEYKFAWYEDDRLLSTGHSFTYRAETLGEHRIQLKYTESNGFTVIDEKIITVVKPNSALVIADAGLDQSFYEGVSWVSSWNSQDTIGVVEGNGSGNGNLRYKWTKGTEVLSSSQRFLTESLEVGKHTLTLTVTDSQGNSDSDDVEITIVERERGIKVNAGRDFTIPVNTIAARHVDSSSYSISSFQSTTSFTVYEWKVGDKVLDTQGNANSQLYHKFDKVGVYVVTLTGTDPDGLVDTDEVTITVVEPESSIFADAGLDKKIYQGTSVQLTRGESYSRLNSNPEELNYVWSEGETILSETRNNGNLLYENNILGDHTLKLTVTDSEGFVDSDEVIITVIDNGLVDITNPVISINGEDNITINVGDVYEDEGATATDDRDGVITGSIIVRNNLLTTFNPGNYQVTYKVKDNAGNEANATRQITVLAPTEPDTLAPVITLLGNNPVSIPQGRSYSDKGATVLDNRDGKIGYSFNSNVNVDVPGTYQYVYTATDAAGNSTDTTRTVNVIADPNRDAIKPVIMLIGETVVSIPQGEVFTDKGATASDNIDGDITSKIVVDNTVNTDFVGQYFVNYSVRDTAGNESILTRTVIVTKVDTPDTLPEILVQSLEWLETQAQADGSYTNSAKISLPIQSTSEVLRAYHRVGEVLAPGIAPALSYLSTDESHKIEFLSRKIIATTEAGTDATAMVTELLGLQNLDKGFGDQGNYHSRLIDSAFALNALGVSNYSDTVTIARIIAYLKTQQSINDGGFSHSSKNQSSVYETSLALISLQNYQGVLDLKSMIDSGNEYLMNSQVAGGGWDSHWETAYALIAITPTVDNFATYQIAADRLKAGQLANGSWDNDVYTTALAIRALYKSENLDTP